MKFYKDAAGTVFAYEDDGSQDHIIPADQVPITQAEADALRFPPPPFDQAAALQRARDLRPPILNALAGIGLEALASGDTVTVQAVLTARQGLLDITKDPGVLAATSDTDFDAAVLARYRQLVAGAPANVVQAFQDATT